MWARRSVMPSNEKRAIDSAPPRPPPPATARSRSRQNAVAAEQPGVGIDHAFGLERFQRALEARSRTPAAARTAGPGRPGSTGSLSTRTRLGSRSSSIPRIVEHADRQVAETRVLGQHGQQRLDHARPEAVADDDAVDVAGVEIARGGLDAERADEADALADRDRQRRIGAAASDAQHGRVVEQVVRTADGSVTLAARRCARAAARSRAAMRTRSAERSRATSRLERLVGGDRQRERAAASTPSAVTRASTGMTGPPRVSMHCGRAPASAAGRAQRPARRSASAAGWISAMAAGASAQPVSTIGNAPALPSTSSKSAADVSATTTIGPSSAMTDAPVAAGRTVNPRRTLLTNRQQMTMDGLVRQSVVVRRSAVRGRGRRRPAAGLRRVLQALAARRSRSAAVPASRWPASASGSDRQRAAAVLGRARPGPAGRATTKR